MRPSTFSTVESDVNLLCIRPSASSLLADLAVHQNLSIYFCAWLVLSPTFSHTNIMTHVINVCTLVRFVLVGLGATEALKTHSGMSYTRVPPNPHPAGSTIKLLPSMACRGVIETREEITSCPSS